MASWFRPIPVLLASVAAGAVCWPNAGLAGGPPPARLPAAPSWSLERLAKDSALSDLEYGTARSDHAEIAEAVAQCYSQFANPMKWSAATQAVFMFQLTDSLAHSVSLPSADADAGVAPVLTSFQMAAVAFSDKLSRDRLFYRLQTERSHSDASAYQVAIVVLSALSTLLIGWRSIVQKDNPYVTHLAVLAIVVSAAGTAVASLSTWGDFASSELRASKTLAQLQQLHWRVASDILKSNVLCSKPDDADWKESVRLQADLMDSWRDRYESVSDGAAAALARPGDLGPKPAAGRPPPDDAQKGGEGGPAPPAAASDAQKPHAPQSGANQMRSAVNVTRTPPR